MKSLKGKVGKGLVEWASRWRSRRRRRWRRRGCLAENPTHIRLFQPTLPNTSHQILFNRKLLKRRLISSVESELGFLGRICIIIKAIWKFKLGVRYENPRFSPSSPFTKTIIILLIFIFILHYEAPRGFQSISAPPVPPLPINFITSHIPPQWILSPSKPLSFLFPLFSH